MRQDARLLLPTMSDDFTFDAELLDPRRRRDGISAFMRIRNGEEFLRLTIESHIDFFDEIVACYNQCTDSTPDILDDLQRKYPDKLRVYHYEPVVYPPGSPPHQQAPSGSIHGMANYSNYALSKTTCRIAVKLDDDHLAIRSQWPRAIVTVRSSVKPTVWCFSGLDLMRDTDGRIGVLADSPLVGNRDHYLFPVSMNTRFVQRATTEDLRTPGMPRRYLGMLYFHLKQLKKDFGLGNYQVDRYPRSLRRQQVRHVRHHAQCRAFDEFFRATRPEDIFRMTRRRSLMRKLHFAIARHAPWFNRTLASTDFYVDRSLRCLEELKQVDLDKELFDPLERHSDLGPSNHR